MLSHFNIIFHFLILYLSDRASSLDIHKSAWADLRADFFLKIKCFPPKKGPNVPFSAQIPPKFALLRLNNAQSYPYSPKYRFLGGFLGGFFFSRADLWMSKCNIIKHTLLL